MANFFQRLFGKNEDTGAYYLDADSAKTFGDAAFMRKEVTIRRTFPKEKAGEDDEIVEVVSSTDKRIVGEANPSQPQAAKMEAPQPKAIANERGKVDTNLDMFRQMAKDMGKK
ncbi:MAG TPA: hypothetical protein DCQ32_07145 [Cyanobacteria bacterium UBA8156]|jgi:predicted transcriptional regulator|nr:hypothetical protein [Cyanobacteria bacterium UBA8156]